MKRFGPAARVLVVDDDEGLGGFITEILQDAKHAVECATNAKDAMQRLESDPFDLLVTDLRMPKVSGIELIQWTKRYDPRISVLAVTAYGSIETAVQAVRAGAGDYITKPFEPDAFLLAVDKCLRERELRLEIARLKQEGESRYGFEQVVAKSAVMQERIALARRIADSPSTVLITGPSGAGKEVFARAIHRASQRRDKPFVAVNCAAIPESLLESELFGHRRGAFTGAVTDKVGLFHEADGGTLFLDEVGELPVSLQAKLLRVLQEREVRPVGATRVDSIDVRLIAATNRDLKQAIETRAFREDLFYRLCVLELSLPPLVDRIEDIVPLAEHFVREANVRLGRSVKGLSGAAQKVLCAYGWPGNIRELQNAIERAVVLATGDLVTPDDLPTVVQRTPDEDFLSRAVERQWTAHDLMLAFAKRVLVETGGNKKKAARILGIDRRTLHRWLGGAESDEDEEAAAQSE
jgi:DNA-binding NtrC family response regulator